MSLTDLHIVCFSVFCDEIPHSAHFFMYVYCERIFNKIWS